jgi:cell division protease FtsH
MVPELGNVTYDSARSPFLGDSLSPSPQRAYSDDTARQIDAAIRDIVDNAFRVARELIAKQRPLLEAAAARLLEKETLTEEDLAELWNVLTVQPSESPAAAG